MSDTVRRALGVLAAIAMLAIGWAWSSHASETAQHEVAERAAARANKALDASASVVASRLDDAASAARSFAELRELSQLLKQDFDEAFVGTVDDLFKTEPWLEAWRATGNLSLYANQRRLYSSSEAIDLGEITKLQAQAEAKGAAGTWVFSAGHLYTVGVSVVHGERGALVVVLSAPVTEATLASIAKEAGTDALEVQGAPAERVRGGSEQGLAHLQQSCDVGCVSRLVSGLQVRAWVDAGPAMALAREQTNRQRTIAFAVAGVLALLVLILTFRSSKPNEEQTQLLRETAAELQRSREELLKLSQRISSPGMPAKATLVPTTDGALDQTAASITVSRYEVVAPLGEGGMARVSVAQVRGAEGFKRLFVVKRLRPELVTNAEITNQFIDEARLGASLVHSNIVPVFDFGRDVEGYFLAQEYILGRDVDALISASKAKRAQPLEPAVVLYLAQEALKALSYAHTLRDDQNRPMGLVHRDVSPNNLMVSARGEVKLLDFGIVKSEQRVTKTQTGVVKGNLFFMSPEQARAQNVDARSDLFSLGLVLYNALVGDTLYHGSTNYELLTRAGLGPTSEDFALLARLPGGLGPLLARALQVDPANRYADADEFARAVATLGPIATAAHVQTLIEWLFKDDLTAETSRLNRTV